MQRANPYLSVVIPTYNRRTELAECLRTVVPQAKRHGVRIYISDNASNYDVASVVKEFQTEYSLITLSRNLDNLGLDANVRKVISLAESEYVWVFPDDDFMIDGALDIILPYCEERKYVWIIPDREVWDPRSGVTIREQSWVNNVLVPTEYTNPSEILTKYGFYQFTFVGSLIIRMKDWRLVNGDNYRQYIYFEHLCILAEMLINRIALALPNVLIRVRSGNASYSDNQVMVWIAHLPKALSALPNAYTRKSRRKVLSNLVYFSATPSFVWMSNAHAVQKFTWNNKATILGPFLQMNAFSWVVAGYLVLILPQVITLKIQQFINWILRRLISAVHVVDLW